jgi:hypothetical protein
MDDPKVDNVDCFNAKCWADHLRYLARMLKAEGKR